MPLMPGSPRPSTPAVEVDSGVYRSLFQQPVLDVPPAAPSYAWFEFLLHPEALQKHVRLSISSVVSWLAQTLTSEYGAAGDAAEAAGGRHA
jgi:hypothetical protein